MRKAIPVLALLLMLTSTFGQNSNSGASGGKISEDEAAPTRKKTVPKRTPNQDKRSYSPCGVYYKNRADMIGESNLDEKWFSLGESANKHFWYNPQKTSCDAKTSVLKSWIKEEHKNTDSNYALVLYEFKCKPNQLRVKTVIEYDKTGGVLETTNHDGDPWQDVAPGTAGVVILRTVCRRP
ncbi:MAG: surface-adhesin E family protein [Pyrinomonadaceae bacterium]